MPICPTHGKVMRRATVGAEVVGVGWDRHQAFYEDFICEECQFRVRVHYTIIDIGRVMKLGEVPSKGTST